MAIRLLRRKETDSQLYWERQLGTMAEASGHMPLDTSHLVGEGAWLCRWGDRAQKRAQMETGDGSVDVPRT